MHSLNPAQQHAVETTEGPVLIMAGAGAGKTRVIVHRILNLIKKGVPPRAILAITFTNKAAKEMRERVQTLLSEDKTLNLPISMLERPFVSTFHALGVHIIRENAQLIGLTRHFTIYDRSDSRRAIKEAMLQASIDPKAFEPGAILNAISLAKGDGMSRLEYLDAAKDYFQEMVANVWEKYEAVLAKEKALDFDDLLVKAVQLLKRPEIRTRYNSIWRYIHIDEYQDTNRVQYQIARLLAETPPTRSGQDASRGHNGKSPLEGSDRVQSDFSEEKSRASGLECEGGGPNICVVGDADQNIYSWRGATIENILNFQKDYPDAVVIALEKNYRSTKIILLAANAIIEKNTQRIKKTLYTDNERGEKISLMASYSEIDEARTIAETAKSLISSGTSPREIAVLYRANFQSRVLEEAFIKKNIPYQLLGIKFFERKEVKDVLSYIRAALNFNSESDVPAWGDIARIINVPPRGIGKVTVAKIISGQENTLPTATRTKVADFWKLLGDIKHEIMEKKPSEAVKFIIQETGIERLLREGDSEDEERLLNIRELVSVAAQYDDLKIDKVEPNEGTGEDASRGRGGQSSLDGLDRVQRDFLEKKSWASGSVPSLGETGNVSGIEALLENAALATDQDDLVKDQEAVKLMTVHASKGLEFENVFIAGLEQDLFPFKHINDDEMSDRDEEEERRLFYVALTRAKKKVYLSYSIVRTIYGAQRVSAPSEFIEDIEKELLEEHVPTKPSGVKAIFIDF